MRQKFRDVDGRIKEGEVIGGTDNYLRIRTPDGQEYNVHGSAFVKESESEDEHVQEGNESTVHSDSC